MNTLRPIGLILTGSFRGKREGVGAPHEDGLRLLLLIPASALVLATLLIIALSLITGLPVPGPDPAATEPALEIWMGSPVIEEQPGDETTRRPQCPACAHASK